MEALIALFMLVLWAVIAYLIYQHAEDRGYSGALWAIIVFVFGVLGLLAYGIRALID